MVTNEMCKYKYFKCSFLRTLMVQHKIVFAFQMSQTINTRKKQNISLVLSDHFGGIKLGWALKTL